jgi:hypothetical protein
MHKLFVEFIKNKRAFADITDGCVCYTGPSPCSEIASKRAMPEIGNEDAISSCGGSEWGEHVAYVEDEALRVLRGAGEDKTVLPSGSFSAGARALPAAAAADADAATTAVMHCLMEPSTGRRVRVVQRVAAAGDGGDGGGGWVTAGVEVWMEQKKTCVAPFAGDDRVILNGGGGEWTLVPERSAAFDLVWPETPAPDATDGGSAFVVTVAAAAAAEEGGAVGPTTAAGGGGGGGARGNLMRLPCGVWVFCGVAADGEEVVVEAGWVTPTAERLFATRRYDARSGRLVNVALGCERK